MFNHARITINISMFKLNLLSLKAFVKKRLLGMDGQEIYYGKFPISPGKLVSPAKKTWNFHCFFGLGFGNDFFGFFPKMDRFANNFMGFFPKWTDLLMISSTFFPKWTDLLFFSLCFFPKWTALLMISSGFFPKWTALLMISSIFFSKSTAFTIFQIFLYTSVNLYLKLH